VEKIKKAAGAIDDLYLFHFNAASLLSCHHKQHLSGLVGRLQEVTTTLKDTLKALRSEILSFSTGVSPP
jgi:hypothetical protein